ncbi:MAG: hypothetical protein ND866_16905, partial [Pyrinomonadaceae bacterium]|nr:hypothetical protein [Pyrinomonadaceae bacterium]
MANIDFSWIGDLGNVYREGRQQALLGDLGKQFASGDVNYKKAAGEALNAGNFQLGMQLLKLGNERESSAAFDRMIPALTGTGEPSSMPSQPGRVSSVSTEIPPEGRALLDTIAGSESNYPGKDPYRVIYGGRETSDLSRFPNVHVPITSGPNVGKTTSAAGRYQYLTKSWNEAKNALGLPDFSPASQDKAAWWDAQRAYKSNTGRDLSEDLKIAGSDPQKLQSIGRGLSTWWTSLPGGIEPNRSTGSFGTRFAGNLSAGAPSAPVPATPIGQQVASTDPNAGFSEALSGPAPFAPTQAPQPPQAPAPAPPPTQVAQAAPQPMAPPSGAMSPKAAAMLRAMASPNLSEGQRSAIKILLDKEIANSQKTSFQKDYEFARSQGFTGTPAEWKKAGGTSVNVNTGGGSDKQIFDALDESAKAARSAAVGLNAIREARAAVEGGGIFG